VERRTIPWTRAKLKPNWVSQDLISSSGHSLWMSVFLNFGGDIDLDENMIDSIENLEPLLESLGYNVSMSLMRKLMMARIGAKIWISTRTATCRKYPTHLNPRQFPSGFTRSLSSPFSCFLFFLKVPRFFMFS
jgi:hypothetical protein